MLSAHQVLLWCVILGKMTMDSSPVIFGSSFLSEGGRSERVNTRLCFDLSVEARNTTGNCTACMYL